MDQVFGSLLGIGIVGTLLWLIEPAIVLGLAIFAGVAAGFAVAGLLLVGLWRFVGWATGWRWDSLRPFGR